ncbi:MAG: hypothetical protein MUD01_25285 [Chloroflexaceae bacterium]|jgi:hypothetical protein|nr:hypothetical protein [Chloroflexaceae bacterium]
MTTIYLIQSAHTDIGFTHPQEQIGLAYVEFYERVLELCAASASAPADSRFKWTCETAWQVQTFLAARPEREAELVQRVRDGQIELTANYLHFTDLLDAEALRRSFAWITDFCQRHALPLCCAMHCDINGWPWALADVLAELGVSYFYSAVHLDTSTDPLGARGSVHYQWLLEQAAMLRPDAPTRLPRAFWWRGPKGGQVLHWLGEHYHLGNALGLSGRAPFPAIATRHYYQSDREGVESLYTAARRELPRYLHHLRQNGYGSDKVLIHTSGFYVDNSPPDDRWCQLIERWNADHDDIKLRTATLGEWFASLDTGDLPTYQVAWPDAWAFGLGSCSGLVAENRRTQRRREAVAKLCAEVPQAAPLLAEALQQERLALEHTFSANSACVRPAPLKNQIIESGKARNTLLASLYLDEAAHVALGEVSRLSESPTLVVPPTSHVAGLRTLHFSGGDHVLSPSTHCLRGPAGGLLPFQCDRAGLPEYVAVIPPALELAGFSLVHAERAAAHAPGQENSLELGNATWQLRLDPATGGLASLRDASGREWVDGSSAHRFGQLTHETIVHPWGRAAVGNLPRCIALGSASTPARESFPAGPIFARRLAEVTASPQFVAGPVFDSLELDVTLGEVGNVHMAWRCYHALPLVELVLEWDKRWCELPEAAYVTFPFAAPGASLQFDTGGGMFRPGSHGAGGQLPGTASTFYTVQRGASIETEEARLLWLPLDAPLVLPNAIAFNRWATEPWQWNGLLASMPVNHYWHTNFPPSQRGLLRLRYRLFHSPLAADVESAWDAAMPLEALGWQ